jgi:hypothetical protein
MWGTANPGGHDFKLNTPLERVVAWALMPAAPRLIAVLGL